MKSLISVVLFFSSFSVYAAVDQSVEAPQTAVQVEKPEPQQDRFQIRIEPHWLAAQQEIAIDFQFKFGEKFSIGPTLAVMDDVEGIYNSGDSTEFFFSDYRTDRIKYGFRMAYYFSGYNANTAFMSMAYNRADNKIRNDEYIILIFSDDDFVGAEAEFTEDQVAIAGGYQWLLGSLTLTAGGGVGFFDTPDKIDMKRDDGKTDKYDLDDRKIGLFVDAGVGLSF